jgi:hypothetical protein
MPAHFIARAILKSLISDIIATNGSKLLDSSFLVNSLRMLSLRVPNQ